MTIRILGGRWKGRRLASVPGGGTRPLLGQVREALFQILGKKVEGAAVWDLFAGTGATGIEAVSRGARSVLFVERGREALRCLRANLELVRSLDPDLDLEWRRGDAWKPPPEASVPDLCFVDPPYADPRENPLGCIERLDSLLGALAPDGRLVFHHPRGAFLETELCALAARRSCAIDHRRYGEAALAIFHRRTPS